jgi:hypothetical protein
MREWYVAVAVLPPIRSKRITLWKFGASGREVEAKRSTNSDRAELASVISSPRKDEVIGTWAKICAYLPRG